MYNSKYLNKIDCNKYNIIGAIVKEKYMLARYNELGKH